MARPPSRPKLQLRPIDEQLGSLLKLSNVFLPRCAITWSETNAVAAPDGYAGFLAVPLFNSFGFLRIPVANEAWGKKTGWSLHSSIPGLRGGQEKHRADDFVVSRHTLDAYKRLDAQQAVLEDGFDVNRLRVFAVRFSEDPEPLLAEDEFHLDLGSLMWFLATHWRWQFLQGGLVLRCLGETHTSHASILVGYQNLKRVLSVHDSLKTQGFVVIGKAPL